MTGGDLTVPFEVAVTTEPDAPNSAHSLDELLGGLNVAVNDAATLRIQLSLNGSPDLGAEGYELAIDDDIAIRATTDAGLFYGVETLRQLLPATPSDAYTLPQLVISDAPQFAYRGSMIDVARNFLPLDYLKRHVDRMAMFKLNRLHLHLADDQGWRLEIMSWPNLTTVGASTDVGGGEGGYFTQDEMRDLVAYAAARNVVIIPEIDLPGHTQAALASYNELACDTVTNLSVYSGTDVGFSELCLTKPEVIYPFVEDVLREVADIFPSKYLHIGGDEIEDPLYPEFLAKVDEIIAGLGRETIAWEEASAGNLRTSALYQLWNDNFDIQPALERGNSLILSPCSYTYLDHGNYAGQPNTYTWCSQDGIPLERAYSLDPQSFTQVHGVEGAMWSEVVESEAAADNRLWPRLAAIAEVSWSVGDRRDYGQFTARMGQLRGHLDALGISYYAEPDLGWG
jgi:hexosaminidase